MPVVTAVEVQKRNKERVNIYLDGSYAFSLNIVDAASLRTGQSLSDSEIAAMRGEDAVVRAVDSAARFLGHRPRSVSEVRRNLKDKEFDAGIIDAAIERLERMGYLDDTAFAQYWVENRIQFKPLGSSALRFELRQKGVSDAVIQHALADLNDQHGARQAAEPLLRRMRGTHRRTAWQKLSTTLARRGFAFEDVRAALDELFQDVEADDDTFFAGEDDDTEHEP